VKTSKKEYPDGSLEWVLSGDKGAVNFLVLPVPEGGWDRPSCIGIHSLVRTGKGRKGNCDVLPDGKCYPSLTCSHAHELWNSSRLGKSEDTIWRELADWYTSRLGPLDIKEP
jgi:hypothetical protein